MEIRKLDECGCFVPNPIVENYPHQMNIEIKPGYVPVYDGKTGEFLRWEKQPDDRKVLYYLQFPIEDNK